jgi:hypothetical protein
MAAPITGLALAALDDDPYYDLAITAGNELVIARGRDRWLSLPEGIRPAVAAAQVERRPLPYTAVSVAAGDFIWSADYRLELALLADDGSLHLLDGTGAELRATQLDLASLRANPSSPIPNPKSKIENPKSSPPASPSPRWTPSPSRIPSASGFTSSRATWAASPRHSPGRIHPCRRPRWTWPGSRRRSCRCA